jgi:hypothetical protein
MAGCNCHGGLGALPVNVTQADPCGWDRFLNHANSGTAANPVYETMAQATLLQKAEHALCEAEHWMANAATGAWGELRAGLDFMWARVEGAWNWVTGKLGAAKTWTQAQIQNLKNDAESLLAKIKSELGVAGEWLIFGLLGLAALYFLPEIIEGGDAIGTRYVRRYKKSVPRAYRRIKARHA